MATPKIDPNEDLREVIRRKRGKRILSGFQINHICLSDQKSGKVYWATSEDLSNPHRLHEIRLPRSIFQSSLVKREINFSSAHRMKNFRIEQLFFFKGHPMEESKSEYGCVIPYSVNNWLTTIKPSQDAAYMPFDLLSGNITVDSYFYDDDTLITSSKMRVYYI